MRNLIFILFFPLSLFANSYKLYNHSNFILYMPAELDIHPNLGNYFLLSNKEKSFYAFINKLPANTDVSLLTDHFIKIIANFELIAKNGFYIIQRRRNQIFPSFKNVGCLEKKWNVCFEILNYYYDTEEVFIKLVLKKSLSLSEFKNRILSLFQINQFETSLDSFQGIDSDKTFLYYNIRFLILSNQKKESLLILTFTPEEYYDKNEFMILRLLFPTNYLTKKQKVKLHRDDFELNDSFKESNVLFVLDNSKSMRIVLDRLQKNLNKFKKKIKQFNQKTNFGILNTQSCKLKKEFSSDFVNILENINLDSEGNAIDSCTYQVEKFFIDSECNHKKKPQNLFVLCFTNQSDAYYLYSNTRFEEKENIFKKNNISFYSIIPLNDEGEPDDCKGEFVDSYFMGDFKSMEEAKKNSVNLKTLAKETQGFYFSICSPFYENILEEISNSILSKSTLIELSRIPISNTIRVWIDNNEIQYYNKNENDQDHFFIFYEKEKNLILKGKNLKNSKIQIEYLTFDY
ncbi:MAG: hypothetical protein ACK4UJ_07460 [Leptonema sp. (in: bacteria)]